MRFLNMFFSMFRSSKGEEMDLPWIRLTSIDQLNSIIEKSNEKPILIFKHSTQCGISSMVFREFQRVYGLNEEQIKLYYLDIISFREISNEVSIRFQVIHKSPQVIIIKDGNTIHHSSHYQINFNSFILKLV